MPYQHDDNYAMYMKCIGKISASIENSDRSNFIILGNFNCAVDTPLESERLTFCLSYDLSISDMIVIVKIRDSLHMSAMHIQLVFYLNKQLQTKYDGYALFVL